MRSTKLNKRMKIAVDPEFEALIPPLSEDEFKQLRENIIESGGCRDPIVLWPQPVPDGNNIILDGHNRWKVIQEFIDTDTPLSFDTTFEMFASRNEAKAWMIRNQLGRRNLPNYERARLALQLKPLLAEEAKKRQATSTGGANPQLTQKSAEAGKGEVRDELAKAAGVSHDTIHKVEVIEEKAAPEVKEQLRKGEVSINKAYNEIRQAESKTDDYKPVKVRVIDPDEYSKFEPISFELSKRDIVQKTAEPSTTDETIGGVLALEPEHIDAYKANKRINNAWKNRNVNSLIVEIDEHTRLMTDATWCDVAYSTELYKTDNEKEMVASALDDSLKRITALLSGLSRSIRESKKEQKQ